MWMVEETIEQKIGNLRDLLDKIKQSNIHINGIHMEKRERMEERICRIMTNKLLNLTK